MNHPVETKTWALVERLLAKVDPAHEGWCIDAGVGADDWWFLYFTDLEYKTLVIDPFMTHANPTIVARDIPGYACMVGSFRTWRPLYMSEDENLHTGIPNRIDPVDTATIEVYPLQYFIDNNHVTHLTCLKLDIEGMEPEVIQSLPDCKILPDILVFEFGGFVKRKDVSGPWSVENVAQVNAAMQTLDILGYGTMWAITDVDEHPFVIGANGWYDFISPECGYGNIVAVREEAFHG